MTRCEVGCVRVEDLPDQLAAGGWKGIRAVVHGDVDLAPIRRDTGYLDRQISSQAGNWNDRGGKRRERTRGSATDTK